MENPYRDHADQPELRRSIVAYVDILGYSDMTQRALRSGDALGFLRRLRETFLRAFARLRPDFYAGQPAPWTVKTFSDNIVIGYPIRDNDGEPELAVATRRLGAFQLAMTLEGFFIRGAVTVGNLYMDEQLVFGPALLDAYKAEKSLARDPRIILTGSAIQAVHDQLKRYQKPQTAWHENAILRDTDHQYFVNYLDEVVAYEHNTGYLDTSDIARHRDVITARLGEFATYPPHWAKYLWAARYHNWFCDERKDFADELKVDDSDIKVQPARLSTQSGDSSTEVELLRGDPQGVAEIAR